MPLLIMSNDIMTLPLTTGRLVGCYEALEGGQTGDALTAFTGGVNEYFDLKAGGYHSDEQKLIELFEVSWFMGEGERRGGGRGD